MEYHIRFSIHSKGNKEVLKATLCQSIRKLQGMKNSLKDINYQSSQNKWDNPASTKEVKFVVKTFPQRKFQACMTSLVNSTKYLKRNNTNSTRTAWENWRRNTSQHILWG